MLILRGLKGEKNMANICAVILGAGKDARIENMANVTVAGRGIVKWALEAAHSAAEDIFIATDDEAVISQANGGARAIGGEIIELVQSIAEYDRAVLLLKWGMGLTFTFFLGSVSIKSLNAAGLDSAGVKALKYAFDKSVPVVGGVISGTYEGLRAGAIVLKNAAGIDALIGCMNAEYIEADEYASAAIVDRKTLSLAEEAMQRRIKDMHFENGVSILQPVTVYIGADVKIGENAVIWPNNTLTGKTVIGRNTELKPGCNINDSAIGESCVLNYVFVNEARVGDRVTIGPYVNLRPKTDIADGCKIGDFVEVKNSNIGEGTKLPHLSYIGDADVGARVNVGCGCVFVNYDGVHKHRTTVGNDVFLGCQTNLVAPVSVGDGAYTAAGSTINKDVPADAMAFARARQENKEGYASRYKALKKGE